MTKGSLGDGGAAASLTDCPSCFGENFFRAVCALRCRCSLLGVNPQGQGLQGSHFVLSQTSAQPQRQRRYFLLNTKAVNRLRFRGPAPGVVRSRCEQTEFLTEQLALGFTALY